MDEFHRRDLSELEKDILAYIANHPSLTAEDVANAHGNGTDIYAAIAYLIFQQYVRANIMTGVLTVRPQ